MQPRTLLVDKGEGMKNMEEQINSIKSDNVFVAGYGDLIEKRLGSHEQISLLFDSIVAFEGTITFTPVEDDKKNIFKYINSLNDIVVEGPGLVIFDPCCARKKLIRPNKYFAITSIVFGLILIIHELVSLMFINRNLQ